MSTWLALVIAIACTIGLWLRFAFLVPTWKFRGRVAIGLAVGVVIGLAQSAIKHYSAPWGLLLIADGYFAVLISMIGMGGYIRESAIRASSGVSEEVPKNLVNRMLLIFFAVGIPLIVIEALLLRHTAS